MPRAAFLVAARLRARSGRTPISLDWVPLMRPDSTPSLGSFLGRKREDSYAPASFAEKLFPVQPTSARGRLLLNEGTHLGEWTGKDWAIDIVDKYVQAQAVGAAFDRLLDPATTAMARA